MAKKNLLIAAGLVASFAALLVFLFLNEKQNDTKRYNADEIGVVYVVTTIPAGVRLTQERIEVKNVPQRFLPDNPLLQRELATYLDMPVSETLDEGVMVLTSNFAVEGVTRSLSGRIPQGERAMSIPVDAVSGVSGLLRPGDHVDILGTFLQDKDPMYPDRGDVYATIHLFQSVLLLAVGQELADASGDSRQQRGGYSTVTVSLTPDESELLTLVQTGGTITLLLRHRDDQEWTYTYSRGRTLDQWLKILGLDYRKSAPRISIRRKPECKYGYTRGADGKCVSAIVIYRGSVE